MQKLFQDLWALIFGTQKPNTSSTHVVASQTSLSNATKPTQDQPVQMDDLLRALGADL